MSTLRVNTLDGATGGGLITLATGATMYAPGSTVQTLFARSGPTKQTISSTEPVAVTGLSVTITPKSASSIIYIQCAISTNAPHVSSYGIFKNATKTVDTTGFTNTNESGMQVTMYTGGDTSEIVRKIAAVIKARQKGQTIEDAIDKIFAPPPPAPEQVPSAGAAPMVEQTSPAPGSPTGGAPSPEGAQIEAPPQQPPDIQSLLSSLTGSGEANASVRMVNRRAVG